MDLEQLDQGSYKGVPFLMERGSITGGNKNVEHSYPNSDRQTIENLGTMPRSFSINIIIPSTNYRDRRNAILSALEDPAPGPLIHPMYGRIENIIAGPYTLNESLTELGDGKLSVLFKIDNGPGVPQQAGLTVASLARANEEVAQAVRDNLTQNYEVTPSYQGSFESATGSVQEASEAFEESQSPLDNADELITAARKIGEDSADLVTDAEKLGSRISAVFDQASEQLESASDALDYYRAKFNFGDNGTETTAKTAAQLEAERNRELLKSAMRLQALSYAYVVAAQLDFATLNDVLSIDQELESQYKAVIDLPGTDTDTREALSDLRTLTLQFFDAAKLTARRIIDVETHPTTARLLAFRYYGTDTQGEDIANLNDGDVSNLRGTVQVLTE